MSQIPEEGQLNPVIIETLTPTDTPVDIPHTPKEFEPSSVNVLKFCESLSIGKSNATNRRVGYQREGSNQQFVTNESNLVQKLDILSRSQQTKVQQAPTQPKEADKSSDQDKQKDAIIRYYTTITSQHSDMRCRRCGEYGHFQKNCTQAQIVKCYYCMGKHYLGDCKQSTCHKCYEVGHMAKNCQSRGSRCFKCGKVGHRESQCGAMLMYDENADERNHTKEDWGNVQCMKCGEMGHVNCEKRKLDTLYGIERTQENKKETNSKQKHSDREGRDKDRDRDRNRDRDRDRDMEGKGKKSLSQRLSQQESRSRGDKEKERHMHGNHSRDHNRRDERERQRYHEDRHTRQRQQLEKERRERERVRQKEREKEREKERQKYELQIRLQNQKYRQRQAERENSKKSPRESPVQRRHRR